MPSAAVASSADLLGAVPVLFLMKTGDLRLDAGRLSFTLHDGTVELDCPVGELHSVAKSMTGFQLWHGATRYRFTFSRANRGKPPAEIRAIADSWVALLQPAEGGPPEDVTVRRPWPMWRWVAAMAGLVAVVLIAVVLLNQLQN